MAQLTAIVDKLLTDASNGLFQQEFIAEQIFPELGVIQKTGKVGKFGKGHLRIEQSYAGGGGAYRRVSSIVRSSDSYDIEGHGLEGIVTADDYRNVEQPFDAEEEETLALTSHLQLEKEKVVADTLGSTAVVTQNTTLVGADQFSDSNNSDPIAAFKTARAAIKAGIGIPPDTALMSWEVAEVLKFHPQMLDFLGFKFDRPGGLTFDELARAMNVKRLLIGSASYNAAKEGQTDDLDPVWGDIVVFGVLPQKAMKRQPAAGYYLKYKNRAARQVYKYDFNNPPGATGILCEDAYDYVISDVGGLYLIKDCLA